MVSQVQAALPGILALTNKIAAVLDNAANATSNLNITLVEAQPMLTNFGRHQRAIARAGRADGLGARHQRQSTNRKAHLTNANSLLANTDTNVTAILINLADITSNLNAQVQANSNMLSSISKIVVDTDDFVQGLKRHWLLRSAFKKEHNAPAEPVAPVLPPRMR